MRSYTSANRTDRGAEPAPLELELLGVAGLRNAQGCELRSLLCCPKRFALLAYLAIAHPRGFHRRDRLVALFWPDLDHAHARATLRQYVFCLRAVLGHERVPARGAEEIALDPRALRCDVWELESALARGEPEQALRAYRGDLLSGLYASAAPELEQWLDAERERLRGLAVDAARRAADRAAACGEIERAVRFARRGVEIVPYDETGVRQLIELLDRGGDRAGAVREYETFARRLARELELEPAPELRSFLERVRERERPRESVRLRSAARSDADDGRFLEDAIPALERIEEKPAAVTRESGNGATAPARGPAIEDSSATRPRAVDRRGRRLWTWREAVVALSLCLTAVALERLWV